MTQQEEAVTIDGVPESVTRGQLRDWLAQLGIDISLLRGFVIERFAITAEVIALNEKGQRFLREGHDLATHVIRIPIADED